MPIVVRRGRFAAEPRSRLLRFERPTGVASVATAIGNQPMTPDPRHELARLALDLAVRTAEPVDLPPRWATYAFGTEVDRTRAQLQPIRSRVALLASFSREASIAATRTLAPSPAPAGPVRVAYAIRWLELGDGRARPAWASFVAGPVEMVAGALSAEVPGAAAVSLPVPLAPAPRDDQRNGEIST
jgi:hypothetical protein